MPTLNKAESARINGAKSRGPVTPEGKQRSSLNAVRHGLLAKSVCLTNEDPEKYKELLQDFLDRFQPTDNVELRLVEQMASAAFRLERFAGTETALFDLEMGTQESKEIDHAARFAMAFKSLADNSKSLQLYLRYEAAIARQYDRAMKQLLDLRVKFPVPVEAEVPKEPNDERTTTNDERRASALPNEPNDEPRASELPNEPNEERTTTNGAPAPWAASAPTPTSIGKSPEKAAETPRP